MARRFAVEVHESTIGQWRHQLRLARLQPRPLSSEELAEAEATVKNFPALLKAALLSCRAGTPVELWFQDGWTHCVQQGRTEGDAQHHLGADRCAAVDGPRQSTRLAWLFGAIRPHRAVGPAIIMPGVNAEAMSEHLAETSTQVAPSAQAVLIRDGAGWRQTGRRPRVPDNITLLPLPPYSPALNPMENVWHFLINDPERIRSIGAVRGRVSASRGTGIMSAGQLRNWPEARRVPRSLSREAKETKETKVPPGARGHDQAYS